jgi:cell wall-associated NlpC family hydrolase
MAEPLTKKQIEQMPRTPYEAVRANLRTGDLVFCSGSYLFSRLIQRFTRSVWSHVGIIYKDDNLERVFVLESETQIGVRLAPLSKYLRDYHGRNRPYRGDVVVARVQPDVDSQAIKRAISFGMDELRDRKYICSELVYECFARAGVKFKLNDRFVSPDDVWNDDSVRAQHRIL